MLLETVYNHESWPKITVDFKGFLNGIPGVILSGVESLYTQTAIVKEDDEGIRAVRLIRYSSRGKNSMRQR